MNFLHWEIEAGPGDVVEVSLDGRANVMLLDPANFESYRKAEPFRYYGGLAIESPARLGPPRRGRWHVVVDLGGHPGTVKAGVKILQDSPISG